MSTIQLKQEAKQYYKLKDYENAKKTYRRIIQIDPNDSIIHGNLAQVYYQQKNFNDCFASCSRALELDQKYKKIYYRRAHCNKELNNYYQCYVDAKSFLELEKDEKQSIEQMKKMAKEMKIKINEDTTKQKKILLFKKTNPKIPNQILQIQNKINVDDVCIQKLQEYLSILQLQKTRFYGLAGKQFTNNLITIQTIQKKIYQKILTFQEPIKKIQILDILNPQKDQALAFLKNKIELYQKCNLYEQAILYLRALNKIQKSDSIATKIEQLKQLFSNKLQIDQKFKKNQEQQQQKLRVTKTEAQIDISVSENNPQSKIQIDEASNKVPIQKQSSIDEQFKQQKQTQQNQATQKQKINQNSSSTNISQENINLSVVVNNNQLTSSSNDLPQIKSQVILKKEIQVSPKQQQKVQTNNIQSKQAEQHLQNQKTSNQQVQTQQNNNIAQNPQKQKISQLIIKLNKYKQFKDFCCLFSQLQKSKLSNLQKINFLHQISKLKCFKMLISGMSPVQKKSIAECIQNILNLESKELKQLYKI